MPLFMVHYTRSTIRAPNYGARFKSKLINQGEVDSMCNVALVALPKSMRDELEKECINVTVVHPGVTRTERSA